MSFYPFNSQTGKPTIWFFAYLGIIIATIFIFIFVIPCMSQTKVTGITNSPNTPAGETSTETLTGIYYYSSEYYLTFSSNNFTRIMHNWKDIGTYKILGNSIIFSLVMWGSDTWTIVDSETLKAPDGHLWRKR